MSIPPEVIVPFARLSVGSVVTATYPGDGFAPDTTITGTVSGIAYGHVEIDTGANLVGLTNLPSGHPDRHDGDVFIGELLALTEARP